MALRFIFVATGWKTVVAVASLPPRGRSFKKHANLEHAEDDGFPLTRDFERQYTDGHWAKDIYGNEQTGHHHVSLLSSVHTTSERFVLHHIWKCGGTHFCEAARESGLSAPVNDGCHRWLDEGANKWAPCGVTSTMASLPYNVIGHECPVDQSVIESAATQGFKWVEVLRDPIEQAASWYMHAVRGNYVPAGNLSEWLRKSETASPGFYNFIPNLQVNWIGGCRDNITEDCYQTALANLDRMDVVLEQSGEKVLGTDKLVKLGWRFQEPSTDEGYISGAQTYIKDMPSAERKHLEELQVWDIKFIRAAREKGLI